jgi:Uma2 family endonuclease
MMLSNEPAAASNLMTWEAFEQLPDGDGYHRELIEGELQILPPPKSGHSRIAHRLHRSMLTAEAAAGGRAFIEAGFKLSADPASWVQPDVSFLRNNRLKATEDEDYFLGAPELAVEVVSPSESAADLDRKVELMLGAGSLAVWVVYPRRRKVHICLPGSTTLRRGAGDTLSMPELLPGWELPVARLFED